ncbi:MAG: sulfotransferase [Verrucomicrobia bacterium]|nr:sulfotransferase [Verrucomicrobiota bacterium]
MIRPLFIIGNKRSGTSLLVRLLNLHPQVFVAHEADIVWILHQFQQSQSYRAHPWDSDRGMRYTLEIAGHLLRRDRSPRENFTAAQLHLMEQGNPWLPPQQKTDLRWMGDKKPFQHTDPELLAFIHQHFPDAHFLHIVRHPFAVAESSSRFNETADGDFWVGLSLEDKVERWTFHEQAVLKLHQAIPDRIHSLRYEDLCRQTEEELAGVFRFLQLTPDPQALQQAARETLPVARATPKLPCSAETTRIATEYGYDLRRPPSLLWSQCESLYWQALKKLRY